MGLVIEKKKSDGKSEHGRCLWFPQAIIYRKQIYISIKGEYTAHLPRAGKISLYLAGVLGNPLEVSADSEGTCCGRVTVV